jgi:hypothetical protein
MSDSDLVDYLNMPLPELVDICIGVLEDRIPRIIDEGARATGKVVLEELKKWKRGLSDTDDKGVHHTCFVIVGIIPPRMAI